MAKLFTRGTPGADPIPQIEKGTLDAFQRAVFQLSQTNLPYRDFCAAFGPPMREMYYPVPVVESQVVEITHNRDLR